jgi:CubicO group peptidase (beta-lactamase class C family)
VAGARGHLDHGGGVAPLTAPGDALDLPATVAAIRAGAAEGLHVGAQLAVSYRDRSTTMVDGLAAPGRPMQPDSMLPWFSATKLATAVAVLQQWERGSMAPDDPVAAYVPEFGAAGKERVTVRHLLTHTAALAAKAGSAQGWDEVLATACSSSLVAGWEPGRRAAYSPRLGFHVLGEVVRRIDGRAFDAYVSEEVFEPLGMADAWLALTPGRWEAYGDRIGVMHHTAGSEPRVIDALSGPEGFSAVLPSSSAIGPASDLLRLLRMLLGAGELDGVRVLGAQTVDAMCARHRAGLRDETFDAVIDWGLGVMVNSWQYEGRPAPYGYGNSASLRAFGHGGSQSSIAFADPDAGVAAVLIFNGMAGEAGHHRRSQPVIDALYADLGLARSPE